MEAERSVRPGGEQAIEPERVEMYVELEPAPEALYDGDGATLPLRDADTPAASAVPAEHRADEHAQHGAAEGMVERQTVAQAVRTPTPSVAAAVSARKRSRWVRTTWWSTVPAVDRGS